MSKVELRKSLDEFSDFDHVVFRLSGENPLEFIDLLKMYGLLDTFQNRNYTASFWSMDSHHLGVQEARAAEYFDHAFIAHSEYLPLFRQAHATYLPCAFSLASNTRVAEEVSKFGRPVRDPSSAPSVCAPFAAYPWQRRNLGYLKAMWAAKELGTPNFFGTVRGGSPPNEGLIHLILSHGVVLNLSLSDDLNMRNFEALALNRVLLTNRVPDHNLLDEYKQNMVFLSPDMANVKEKLEEALRTIPDDISAKFLERHSLWARVEEITNILIQKSGQVFFPDRPSLSKFDGPEAPVGVGEITLTPHSPELLLARSQWISPDHLAKVMIQSRSRFSTAIIVMADWVVSLVVRVVASTIGRLPRLRALLRAFSASQL